jgi:Leucine-rich repeat (LRR) protein
LQAVVNNLPTEITLLDLSGNYLRLCAAAAFKLRIGRMASLVTLRLSSCALAGSGARRWAPALLDLTLLAELDLSDNGFEPLELKALAGVVGEMRGCSAQLADGRSLRSVESGGAEGPSNAASEFWPAEMKL